MNRKLLLLDVVLLAVVAYAAVQFRDLYRQAKSREAAQRSVKVTPVPPPPVPPVAPPAPVLATTYAPIAQKLLLSKDRNPEVPIDAPPPPPPPPPMPPLPLYHGMMNFGDAEGNIAIMSVAANRPHKAIHRGETIGEFKLLGVSKDGIDLEWHDQKVHKTLEEVTDRSHNNQAQAAPAVQGGYATAPPPPQAAAPPKEYGPGGDGGPGIKRCVESDTTPVGKVVDGYRKVVRPGPFGPSCFWEAVGGH